MMKIHSILTAALCASSVTFAADYTHWRGPHQTGVFDDKGLPAEWSKEGKNLTWKLPVGGRSAPLIMGGKVFLINRSGDGISLQERVMAIELETGKVLWEHKFNAFMTDIVAHRLGWSNLAGDPETGYIYAHGVQGMFFCFTPDGEIVWKRSLTESFGRISGYGGRTNTPIVEGDLVLISSLTSGWGPHGKGLHRMLAMDKKTGDIKYWAAPSGKPLDTTYSVPVVVDQDGERVLFMGLADGTIVALNPYTGAKKWQFTLSKRGINSSVVYADGKVYAQHSEENIDSTHMGKVVCLDGRTGEKVWEVVGLPAGYTSPAYHDGLLYVADNSANLHCLDAQTGESHWHHNYGKEGKGSPVIADGKVYIGEVGGSWHILKPSKDGCETINSVSFAGEDGSPLEIYATAGIGDGYVVLSNMRETYCISLNDKRVGAAAIEYKVPSHKQTAEYLQIEPAETMLAPGESVQFKIRHADGEGAFTMVDPSKAGFSVKGLQGEIKADGTFPAAGGGSAVQAGMISADVGCIVTSARVRIIGPIPYTEDFESHAVGAPPPGWISSKLKSQVVEHEGGKVLKKLADRPAPPFARLRCYMTPPIDIGYTVQTDLYGYAKKRRFIPDMGLMNSRYLCIMLGSTERTRKLRLVSYAAVPRLQHDIEFP
ncbi:MAG: PQQ-binding-like beta-propeller repeat protein, partial [Verrucomicrobiota bacterium]